VPFAVVEVVDRMEEESEVKYSNVCLRASHREEAELEAAVNREECVLVLEVIEAHKRP